ncbi:hypothetical protein BH10BDE1_BH10BDE1_06640 [soil metagenome]
MQKNTAGFAAIVLPLSIAILFSLSAHAAQKVYPKRKTGITVVKPEEAQTPVVPAADPADDFEPVAKRGTQLDLKNAIRLNYGRSEWNSSPTKIDEAVIFLREADTGRIVQIQAEETAPDSATFSGIYSINWQKFEEKRIEFYAPPQKLLAGVNGRKKISQMIELKELRRLPFVLRRDPITGLQNIELFDSADQARLAYKAFQSEQALLQALKSKAAQKGLTANSEGTAELSQTVDTAMLADKAAFEKLSKDLNERVRLSQIETQKLSQMIQKFGALTPDERTSKKKEAQAAADQAMIDYRANRFVEARESFDKAVELDPTNRSYYYQYGITLYKNLDFNRSLVYLDLSEELDISEAEKDFYRGLNYYQLKDNDNALAAFQKSVDDKDPEISPSSNFYRGLILFGQKKWVECRAEFQRTLDTSNDPALDERAEAYIENILRQQQAEAERARRWTLSGTAGVIYDDNVLVSSDSDRDRGVATDLEAFRTLAAGSARYRALYEENQEWAAQIDLSTMYSVGKDFQTTQTVRNADPTVVGLTLPWTYKGTFQGKGYKFDFVPGYESTFMSIENNEWKSIFHSYLAGFQNLFVMNERWYMNLNVDLRQDAFTLDSSTGDNDSTALKTKLTWSNINFLADKKQLIVSDLSYTSNNSLGKNTLFNRVDLGVAYVTPWNWNTTVLTKLSYFMLTYPQNSNGRIDNSYTLILGLTRPWNEMLTLGLTGLYTMNNSNVSANQYKKLNLMITLAANNAF